MWRATWFAADRPWRRAAAVEPPRESVDAD
jgi:hypothetical protein